MNVVNFVNHSNDDDLDDGGCCSSLVIGFAVGQPSWLAAAGDRIDLTEWVAYIGQKIDQPYC